jgi:hypothetical protein
MVFLLYPVRSITSPIASFRHLARALAAFIADITQRIVCALPSKSRGLPLLAVDAELSDWGARNIQEIVGSSVGRNLRVIANSLA